MVKFSKKNHYNEIRIITAIALRAFAEKHEDGIPSNVQAFSDLESLRMDIEATHNNGNPLALYELLQADNFNFHHDVGGIFYHLDRSTGKLMNFFVPRFSVRDWKAHQPVWACCGIGWSEAVVEAIRPKSKRVDVMVFGRGVHRHGRHGLRERTRREAIGEKAASQNPVPSGGLRRRKCRWTRGK